MQRQPILAATLAAALAAPGAQALETQTRQDLTALGAIAAGAVAGGPIGAIAGMVGGAWLAEKVGEADGYAAARKELARLERAHGDSRDAVLRLQEELAAARGERRRLVAMTLQQLQLAMLFRSGDSRLSAAGERRLALLADYLRGNPQLQVRVAGFADPRGSDGDNLALSRARAAAVAAQLERAGVAASRIRVTAYGEAQSAAAPGDLDGYALERRVTIELGAESSVAQGER